MAVSLTKPFLGAPHTSTESLHSPSLLLSRNIIQLPARRSQLRRLGLTTGSPIKVYSETSQACRPSRAYCSSSTQGGGKSVDRENAVKVAGGFVAIDFLNKHAGTNILAYVSQPHNVVLPESLVDHETLTFDQINGSAIKCPNPEYAEKMIAAIDGVRVRGDSIGGTVTCIVRNFPRSRGSRAFHKIAAELAKGVRSLPGTEGFEIGSVFTGAFMTGSEYIDESGQSGGIQGGISNPETIKMRIAFRPIVPISGRKNTVSRDKHKMEPIARGNLDFCVGPLYVTLVETTVAQLLLCKLITECAPCLMSPINAASHEPLESVESASTDTP